MKIMNKQGIKNIIGLVVITITIGCSSQTAPIQSQGNRTGDTVEVKRKIISWEEFDPTSTMGLIDIRKEHLQGVWTAYQGALRNGYYADAIQLTTPALMEVKDDSYRRNAADTFTKFIISDNLIIKATEGKMDTGIINKITATELTISWKDKTNYTRYYYTK
ncbi:MAG: hypothetical protein V4643_13110 [Bacteroidota bacterium]